MMTVREETRERVYADSTYQFAFPVLTILSFSLSFLVLWYAVAAAEDGEGGAWLVVLLVGGMYPDITLWLRVYVETALLLLGFS